MKSLHCSGNSTSVLFADDVQNCKMDRLGGNRKTQFIRLLKCTGFSIYLIGSCSALAKKQTEDNRQFRFPSVFWLVSNFQFDEEFLCSNRPQKWHADRIWLGLDFKYFWLETSRFFCSTIWLQINCQFVLNSSNPTTCGLENYEKKFTKLL